MVDPVSIATSRGAISIRTVDGVMHVDAWRHQDFAVHGRVMRGGISDDEWSITHVPSGIAFLPVFPAHAAALSAAREIQKLRSDWATFDPSKVDEAFLHRIKAIYRKYGGISLPARDSDRRSKLGRQNYATDLNGYRAPEQRRP